MSSSLESLLAKKRSIIDNVDSYYHNVSVATKHVRRVVFTWKIWHTYHDELRFNDAKFRKDLADIDAEINSIVSNIRSNESLYSSERVYDLQRQSRQLDARTTDLSRSIHEKQHKSQVLSNIPAKVSALQRLDQEHQTKFARFEEKKEELSKEQEEFLKIMEEDLQQRETHIRAEMLAGIFHEDGSELVTSHIVGIGVDFGFLAYLAIQNKDKELLIYSLMQGANLDQWIKDGKTLIQHVLDSEDEDITSVALETTQSFNCSIIHAIKRGDSASLEKILDQDSTLIYKLISEYSVVQHMVAFGMYDMAIDFIKTHPDIVNIVNEAGANIFKTSLISKAPIEFFEELAQYLNIQNEVSRSMEDEIPYHQFIHMVKVGLVTQNQLDDAFRNYSGMHISTSLIDDVENIEFDHSLGALELNEVKMTGELYTPMIEII